MKTASKPEQNVPITDRSSKQVDVGVSDFRAGSSDQLKILPAHFWHEGSGESELQYSLLSPN